MIHLDELGAHVSVAGGTDTAPGRAADLDAAVIQIFTKQPNRWAEREVGPDEVARFRAACAEHGIEVGAAHDSYLINLASPDSALYVKSLASFTGELRRSVRLKLDFVVTHPGNATDGDVARGIRDNARGIVSALDAVPGATCVLLEGTAGTGTALGSTFEELARLLTPIADSHGERIGICLDTCHLWAAGYDLRQLDDVLDRLDASLGIHHLRLMHLNDSATPFASRRDRHAGIGEGSMGEDVFAAIMNHPALASIPKVIETPKEGDPVTVDRRNLARLRSYRGRSRLPTRRGVPAERVPGSGKE